MLKNSFRELIVVGGVIVLWWINHVTRVKGKTYSGQLQTEVWIQYEKLKLHCLSPQKLFGSQESSSVQLWVSYNRQPMKAARFMTRHPITVSLNTGVDVQACCEWAPLNFFCLSNFVEHKAAAAPWMNCWHRFIILLLLTLKCMWMIYRFRAIMRD